MTQSPSLPELPKPAELLPCPFCGGAAHCHDYRGGAGYWQVECQDCDATTDGRRIKSDAIEVWNRRTCYEAGSAAAAQAVPEGFVLVPREPTLEMLERGHHKIDFDRSNQNTEQMNHPSHFDAGTGVGSSIETDMRDAWEAMLAAAPTQGAEGAAPQAGAFIDQDCIASRVACEMRGGRDDVFADPPSMTAEPSDPAYSYALSLATTLWARYYKAQSPNWQPLRDTLGLLTQIDNMIAGIPAYARVASLEASEDTQRLDWLEKRRVSIIPEFEGPWDATVYGDEDEPQSVASGNTPRAAIDAARAALAQHQPQQGEAA